MRAIKLKTEYLKDPIGIDITEPRLFWNCGGGVTQTAYQIVCTDERGGVLWDTGKTQGNAMRVQYAGKKLGSGERVTWKARLWDENDEPGEWSEAFFELGLLNKADWQAKWITGNYTVNKKERYPVDCFKKVVSVKEGIKKARLYITACGLYEARMDGKKIGDFCLAPGHTDYRKRVQYQTYDVTDMLREGKNELTVQLADGWYRGSCGAWGLRNQYGSETKLLAQLEIDYADGSRDVIFTDDDWAWSNNGPIRFADNKDGEVVEAFRTPLYEGTAKLTSHKITPTASNNVPVTEHERFKPTLITTPSGKKVLDFGQNIAGYIEFEIMSRVGKRIFLRFGEMLDGDGEFTQKNIQCSNKRITTPLQQVDYTFGEGRNHYKTTFAVFGFQYVLVETDVPFEPEDFTAIAVYSDMEQTVFFTCSNELLNRFFAATVWSAKGNHLDIPTDCPTRERHGWTGDAQIFFNTAAYLFDFAAFSRKYLTDVYDWQKKDGKLPQIAPYGGVDFYMGTMNGSVGWSDIGILLPYRFWKIYGDKSILIEYYARMKKYAEFMISRMGKWGGVYAKPTGVKGEAKKSIVNCGQSYDEWAEPMDVYTFNWTHFAAPHPEVSTAYTAYVLGILSEISKELGCKDDAARYERVSGECKTAYRELVKQKGFELDTDRQARLVRPIYMELLDEKQTAYARERLIQALENYGWRLGTGFLSTPLILDVLADIDIEAAYKLLENEEMPGWLSMPKNGASTIWEGWEGPKSQGGIASLNHYSKGAVCEWLFKTMCGIRVDGENHFTVAPRPGGHFTHAKASYDSIYGKVETGWEKQNGMTIYTITIPANCTAEVCLPKGRKISVSAGEYRFTEEYYLAIDIGASSGRHIVGWHEGGELKTKEVYRFPNGMKTVDEHLTWDIEELLAEVKSGIVSAIQQFGKIESLSIDTWGVDYVLLRGDEEVMPCYAYRDGRAEAVIPQVHELMPFSELYRRTGIQFQSFNTVYQLYADKLAGRLEGVTDFLMIPEYLLWKLCGVKAHEYTNATTGGMLSAETGEYDPAIIKTLGLPECLFQPLQRPGTVIGEYQGIKCVLCATHDTGSAVEGIPMDGNHPYISSGTWSLLGVKTPKPVTTAASELANWSNEGGVGYNRYQKNIMGMWLINRLKDELCPNKPFSEIVAEAEASRFEETVDANAPVFMAPESMKAAFDKTLSVKPQTVGDYFRCAYRSLALSYMSAVQELQHNTGEHYDCIYIVGGGAKNDFLNRLTEEATGKKVIALPIEATALGNLKIQMEASP